MRFIRQMLTVAGKDLRSEIRTKESLNAAVSFAIVILVLFSFAVDPSADDAFRARMPAAHRLTPG